MSFPLNDIGKAASKTIEDEIASRKERGARKLLRHEASQMALKVAGNAFSVDMNNIQTLFSHVPEILDTRTREGESVGDSIRRIVVQKALNDWRGIIDRNVAKQHAPNDISEVISFVPDALKYLNWLCKKNRYYPEKPIDAIWIGIALSYLQDQESEKLAELERETVEDVLRSLAREIDTIAWAIKSAAGSTNQKARQYHDKLLELMDMVYMMAFGQIEPKDIAWPNTVV